jgi:hypothetical protein
MSSRVSVTLDDYHWGLLDMVAERQGVTRSALASTMVTEALDNIVSEIGGAGQLGLLHPLLAAPKDRLERQIVVEGDINESVTIPTISVYVGDQTQDRP